jgi:Zn-dependent protease with chaperone function
MRLATLLACLCLLLTGITFAQTAAPSAQPQTSAGQTITQYTLPPDKLAKAKSLYTTQIVLMIGETLYGFLVLLLIVRGRLGATFRNMAERLTRFRFVQAYIVVPALFFVLAALNLPFDIYGHHVYLQYGISVQGWSSWLWDWIKSQLVLYVIFSLVIWILYSIIRRSPQRWWFYFWLISIPIVVFITFIAPIVLDPIFNKFEPLEKTNPALVQAIHKVTERGGLDIPPERMYEMKASEKVTDYNAYVTGMGATKRVVVWDTTEHDMTTDEILFVFGHEMGHYVLGHIWKGILFLSAMLFIAFYVGFVLVRGAISRWRERLGIRELGDWASLPLLMLIFSVLSFIGTPIGSTFSRHIEHQADVYGLEVIHGLVPESSHVAAVAFQKLGEKSYDYPYPNRFLVFWIYNHPAIADRLVFALDYKPWEQGKPSQYVK